MAELSLALITSSFVAGLLMFLAPCTLPLVPAFLAFIAGVKPGTTPDSTMRRKIVVNSFYYVIGFSCVFIFFGTLAGLAGTFVGSARGVLIPLSGVLVIIFGLQLLHIVHLEKFFTAPSVGMPSFLTPGSKFSALVIGGAFALGWTPCIGPILATILLLAGSSGTVFTGMLLLAFFSLGLAIPFLLVAFLYARASTFILKHQTVLRYTEFVGGLFLVLIGILLLTNNFELTILYGYKILSFFGIGDLLDYY